MLKGVWRSLVEALCGLVLLHEEPTHSVRRDEALEWVTALPQRPAC